MWTVSVAQSNRSPQVPIRRDSALHPLADRWLWLCLFIASPLLFSTFMQRWTVPVAFVIPSTFILYRLVKGHFISHAPGVGVGSIECCHTTTIYWRNQDGMK